MNKSLQLAIVNEMAKYSMETVENLAISCVLYKQIDNIINTMGNGNNSIASVLTSYSGNIVSQVQTLKGNYLSYDLMLHEVKLIGKTSFYLYNDSEVDKIFKMYLSKTKIQKFSIKSYSNSAYKVENISYKEYLRLQYLHRYVMVPICEYFKSHFSIQESDLEIYSVQEDDDAILGNEIIFSINNIAPARIVSVLKTNQIPLELYDAEIYSDMVRIFPK